MLGANGIVGRGAGIAAGAAWALAAGTDRVVACFFGDGAVNQGVLLEALQPGLAVAGAGGVRLREQRLRHHDAGATGGGRHDHRPGRGVRHPGRPPSTAGSRDGARGRGRGGRAGPGRRRADACRVPDVPVRRATTPSSTRPGCATGTTSEVAAWQARDPVEHPGAPAVPAEDRARIDAEIEELLDEAVRVRRWTARARPGRRARPPLRRRPAGPGGGGADAEAVLPEGAQPGPRRRDGARPGRVRARRGHRRRASPTSPPACWSASARTGCWTRRCRSRRFTNFATGAAMAGQRPVIEFQIPSLLFLVFEQIANQAHKFSHDDRRPGQGAGHVPAAGLGLAGRVGRAALRPARTACSPTSA